VECAEVELRRGDRVKTEVGAMGKVVHASRLTVFVAFDVAGNEQVEAFLESQLTKIELADFFEGHVPA
jgi:hypothetical protein